MKSRIIQVVLDSILHATNIDPEAISPDDNFKDDLGVTPQQLKAAVQRASSQLKVQVSFDENSSKSPSTPRELVELFLKSSDQVDRAS